MTIPFNFKDRVDAIYYWGIKHNLSYREIQGLLNEFETEDITDSSVDSTKTVGNYIAEIDDIGLLREYLRYNSFSKKRQYESAAKEVSKMALENAKYAEAESQLKSELESKG